MAPTSDRLGKPSALDRAAAALAANPAKSYRAIAAEIGVSHQTVKRAAEQMKDAGRDVTRDDVTDLRPRDPLAYVTRVLSVSRASPAQKDRILRAMTEYFRPRGRPRRA